MWHSTPAGSLVMDKAAAGLLGQMNTGDSSVHGTRAFGRCNASSSLGFSLAVRREDHLPC